jgi:STAS-like domain of unknown function (DUF4325)
MSIINFSEFGSSLGTRFLGEETRKRVAAQLSEVDSVLIDFSGVTTVTHSFADEIFGELISSLGLEAFKRRIHFAGANDDIRAIIRFVISERLHRAHQ